MKSTIGKQPTSQQEQVWFNKLSHYTDNMSEEHKEIIEIVKEGIEGRMLYDEEIYQPIADALAGKVVDEKFRQAFAIDLGSNEARLIMLNKAAAFDTSALDIELKPILKNSDTNGTTTANIIMEFNKFLNSYLSTPKFDFVFSDAIRSSRAFPMAVTLIGWDDNVIVGNDTESVVGDITCTNIPISDFWWDPAATTIEECDYAFIQNTYSYRKLRQSMQAYKDFDQDLLDAAYYSNGFLGQTTLQYRPDRLVSLNNQINYGSVPLIAVFRRQYGKRPKDNKVKVYYVIGQHYVIASTEWNVPMLPFAIIKEQSVPNSFIGVSSVQMAMDKIKTMYIADHIALTQAIQQKTSTYVVSQASGLDTSLLIDNVENSQNSAAVINGDVNNAVALLPTAPMNPELIMLANKALTDIDRLTQSTDLINGVTNSSITGAAVRSKEEQATIKDNTSVTELKKYLVRFTSIVVEFMKNNLFNGKKDEKATIFLRSKNNNKDRGSDAFNFWELTKPDLEHIVADIDINCSLLRTSKKIQQAQDLINLYQIGLQYKSTKPIVTIEEIIDVLNIPNKDIILERISQENQDKEIKMATQLVQSVMQALQSGDPNLTNLPIDQLVLMILEQMNQTNLPTNSPQEGQ